MGWTQIYGATRSSTIRECTKGFDNDSCKAECIAHCCTGNNLWTVFERTIKPKKDSVTGVVTPALTYRFICLFMMNNHKDGVLYKDVDESMGPNYVNCPLGYITMAEEKPMPADMVSCSNEWRQSVREHWARVKAATKVAKTLKPGDEFTSFGKKYVFERDYSKTFVVGRVSGGFQQYRIKKASIIISPPVPVEAVPVMA